MSDASDYLRDALGEHLFSGVEYPMPTDLYLALYTTAPTSGGGGVEVDGGNYSRTLIEFQPVGPDGEYENDAMIVINDMPAADIVALGIHDADVAGELLFLKDDFGTLEVSAGGNYIAPVGSIKIRVQ